MKIVLLFLIGFVLQAADCEHCQKKYNDAFFSYNGVKALYIGNKRALSIQDPQKNSIYNPFLDIYLINNVTHFQSVELKYPFYETDVGLLQQGKAPKDAKLYKGCGLREFAATDQSYQPFSVFSGLCCHLLGVSTAKHIVDAKFLNEFIQNKDANYGDIGVRFTKGLVVDTLNPYLETPLQQGDKIVGENLCAFEEKILFSPVGKTITVNVKRNNKDIKQNITVHKRYGGGARSDTFLEQFGMIFNKNLEIITLLPNSLARKKGLKKGDRLLEVERTKIKSAAQLRRFLTQNSLESYNYLFDRDDFQFFIRF